MSTTTPSTPAAPLFSTPAPAAGGLGSGTTPKAETKRVGRILQVIGPVVDVEFDDFLPEANIALTITNPSINDKPDTLVVEVALHLGEHTVRAIAMDSTDGLVRGMEVRDTGKPISVPVGTKTLGRILNGVGARVDERGRVLGELRWPIHRRAPRFVEQSTRVEPF